MNLVEKKTINAKYFLMEQQIRSGYDVHFKTQLETVCIYSLMQAKQSLPNNSGQKQIREKAIKLATNIIMSKSNSQILNLFTESRRMLTQRGKAFYYSMRNITPTRSSVKQFVKQQVQRIIVFYESTYLRGLSS